jgi:hypothetical protein
MKLHRHLLVLLVVFALAVPAFANHSWGGYHWARTSNPFSLKLYDNVDPIWESHLSTAVSDWNRSTVLDYAVQWQSPLSKQRRCTSASGVVEVCNDTYGNNGWLGIAGISVSGTHITKGYTKLNDSYFNTSTYNKPEWRRLVACQEIAHDFGLDHQDENFNNANLGTCMDYTSNPLGPPDNTHPNQHDYDEISIIYQHTDSTTTIASINLISAMSSSLSRPKTIDEISSDVEDNLGVAVRFDRQGRPDMFVRPISVNAQGALEMEVTHIFWLPDAPGNSGNPPGQGQE